jgi:hypothetical protein
MSCSSKFINCELKSVESTKPIAIVNQNTDKCSQVTAPSIIWKNMGKENLNFEGFNCREFHIFADNIDDPVNLVFSNCQIEKIHLYGKQDECSDL